MPHAKILGDRGVSKQATRSGSSHESGMSIVFRLLPQIQRGRTRWCLRVEGYPGAAGNVLEFCAAGLEPGLIDEFFTYRQFALGRTAWIGRETLLLRRRRGGPLRVETRHVTLDMLGWPLPAHLLLALVAASTVRNRTRRREIIQCYATLDPLEPVTPKLYDLLEAVLGSQERIPYTTLSRLARCFRCWC